MNCVNPEHIKKLLDLANKSPYCRLLGLEVVEVTPGRSKVVCRVGPQLENMFGIVHGGVYAALVDSAAYWAVYCSLEEECGYTTIDLSVDNLASVQKGTLIAEGKLVRAGQTLCVSSVIITDENKKKVAFGSSKLMILRKRQSIQQGLENLGISKLPPKFRLNHFSCGIEVK